MLELQACIACLATDCLLHDISSNQLENLYCWISGIKADDLSALPHFLCVECAGYVTRFQKFRDKCQRAYFAYKELLKSTKQINKLNIASIDRETIGVNSTLSYLNIEPFDIRVSDTNTEEGMVQLTTSKDFKCSTIDCNNKYGDAKKETNYIIELIKKESVDNDKNFETSEVSVDGLLMLKSNNDDDLFSEDDKDEQNPDNTSSKDDDKDTDEPKLEQEYATLVRLTNNEAQAASEVYKMFAKGNNCCNFCHKTFITDERYKLHLRMHDQVCSGFFKCEFCSVHYKTEFLLKTHITDKHMYKYLCRSCNEVTFDRASAKRHYISAHVKSKAKSYLSRPYWRVK